jgi:hypothetical protein
MHQPSSIPRRYSKCSPDSRPPLKAAGSTVARQAVRGGHGGHGESGMSGPKVVRTVTREEILGICHGQLARVDAALAEWTRIGRRNNCIDEEAVAASVKRRDALAALRRIDHALNVGCPALKRIALLGAAAASIVSWISDYGVEISAARWVVNAWFNTFSMTCSKPLSVVTSFSCSFDTSPHQIVSASRSRAGSGPRPATSRATVEVSEGQCLRMPLAERA